MDVRPVPARLVVREGLRHLLDGLQSSFELLEGLNDYVAVYDREGTIVSGNRKAGLLIGRRPETLIGEDFKIHVVPAEHERVQAAFSTILRGEATPEFETRFLHADGTEIHVLARLLPATHDGEIVGVYGIGTDLRAQRAIERVFANNAQKFRSLFEHHTDAIAIADVQGRFAAINIAAEQLTGYLNEEVVHKPINMLFAVDDGEVNMRLDEVARSHESTRYTLRLKRKDGSQVVVEGETIPIIVDGIVTGFFAVSRDVTERRRVAAEIAVQSQRIHQLYRVASAVRATPEEQVIGALQLGLQELGFEWGYIARLVDGILTVTHSVGDYCEFGVGYSQRLEETMMRHAIAQNAIFIAEDLSQAPWSTDKSGRAEKYLSFVGIPIRFDGGPGAIGFLGSKPRLLTQTDREYIVAIVALATASVERGLHHDRLDALAFHDTLTDLPNRLLFTDRLEQKLNSAKRRKRSFAVLYIDFDRFKDVNDTYGHAVGDAFLIEMARRFLTASRESDTVARIGGDEFVILQPEITDAENAMEFASRLIETTLEPMVIGEVTLQPSISIGVSIYPHDGTNAQTLLQNADTALYRVKAAGRNGFALYEPQMEARPRPRGTT